MIVQDGNPWLKKFMNTIIEYDAQFIQKRDVKLVSWVCKTLKNALQHCISCNGVVVNAIDEYC